MFLTICMDGRKDGRTDGLERITEILPQTTNNNLIVIKINKFLKYFPLSIVGWLVGSTYVYIVGWVGWMGAWHSWQIGYTDGEVIVLLGT